MGQANRNPEQRSQTVRTQRDRGRNSELPHERQETPSESRGKLLGKHRNDDTRDEQRSQRYENSHDAHEVNIINWRTANDGRQDEISLATGTVNNEPSLCQQSFTEDADINVIVRRFGLDKGPLPTEAINPRYYGDFTDVPDLRTALELVRDAENKFMDLPADIRKRFDNSAAKMWHFVNDPDNAELAVKWGLLKTYVPDTPTPPTDTLESVSPST
ncbi:MAG: internal scaffolding protein [Microvirus sp.]|nr:MAG: internal scaffolding protein [Microvirus sp.]